MKITLTLLLFGVFILSCEGDAPTEGSQEAVSPFDGATGAWISMNIRRRFSKKMHDLFQNSYLQN